jgi:hypothetical protein
MLEAAKFGHCFKELGDGPHAEYFARRSLDMVDGYTRGRTFNVLLLANAHLQQHDLDAACATGNQALDLAAGLRSARTSGICAIFAAARQTSRNSRASVNSRPERTI